MATNFVQDGDILDLLAPYDLTSGQGMQVGQIFAVALGTALSGAAIRGKTTGVCLLTKVGSQAWAVGDKIYWDNSNRRCTTGATAGMLIGVATAAAGSGSGVVTGYVRLNGVSPSMAEGAQATIAALTDNSGGTAADTIAAIGGTYSQAEVRNAVASLAAKINAIVADLKAAGVVASS